MDILLSPHWFYRGGLCLLVSSLLSAALGNGPNRNNGRTLNIW